MAVPFPRWQHGSGDIPRRTGAGVRLQVNPEVVLGKMSPVGTPWPLATSLRPAAKAWRFATPVRSITQGLLHRYPSALRSFHQFQRPTRSVTGQYVHRSDQLRVGVQHHRRLVSIEPPVAALAVAHSGSCTDKMRSRLTPSLKSAPPSVRFTSWSSNWPNSSYAATIPANSAAGPASRPSLWPPLPARTSRTIPPDSRLRSNTPQVSRHFVRGVQYQPRTCVLLARAYINNLLTARDPHELTARSNIALSS